MQVRMQALSGPGGPAGPAGLAGPGGRYLVGCAPSARSPPRRCPSLAPLLYTCPLYSGCCPLPCASALHLPSPLRPISVAPASHLHGALCCMQPAAGCRAIIMPNRRTRRRGWRRLFDQRMEESEDLAPALPLFHPLIKPHVHPLITPHSHPFIVPHLLCPCFTPASCACALQLVCARRTRAFDRLISDSPAFDPCFAGS